MRLFYFLSQISKYVLIRFLSSLLDHNRQNTAYAAALILGCRADAVAPLDFWAHNFGTIIGNDYPRVFTEYTDLDSQAGSEITASAFESRCRGLRFCVQFTKIPSSINENILRLLYDSYNIYISAL